MLDTLYHHISHLSACCMAAEESSTAFFTRSATPPNMSNSGDSVKPTLLAFHGSGSNATIHTVQLARLNRVLKEHFNVETLEGI